MISDRRAYYRQALSSLYIPFYDKLCTLLGPPWQPYSGYRSFDEQKLLYEKGRLTPGGIVTNAKAGQSAHNYGCGSDWTIFKDSVPVWLKKEDPQWKEYVDAVTAAGLRPGAEFGDIDHNELKLSCDWPHILVAYNQGGSRVAQEKIESALEA